jgi:hypothetical protein
VRSPLPNRQPSRRSAPAITANSPAAVPVPRSLCGCTDSTMLSRRARLRCIHSIMSAKMFGVECSTVDGRLTMHLRSRRRLPDFGHRIDHALGERQLGAGEHLGRVLEDPLGPGCCAAQFVEQPGLRGREFDDAVLVQAEHHLAHDRRGGVVQVHDGAARALQRLEGARISGSRACVSTWMVTSSGSGLRRSACGRSRTRPARPRESRPRSP